jgi:hypothetical protein
MTLTFLCGPPWWLLNLSLSSFWARTAMWDVVFSVHHIRKYLMLVCPITELAHYWTWIDIRRCQPGISTVKLSFLLFFETMCMSIDSQAFTWWGNIYRYSSKSIITMMFANWLSSNSIIPGFFLQGRFFFFYFTLFFITREFTILIFCNQL